MRASPRVHRPNDADAAAAEAAMEEPGEDIPAEAVWAELGIADDK